jgi:hypothetical protein
MSFESLTYADLADRLGTTSEAARALVRRLKLPRQPGNDGKVRITVDLAEIQDKPMPARSPAVHRPVADGYATYLEAKITDLEHQITQLKIVASGHRADFDRERERSDMLVLEIVRFTAFVISAREKAARLEGELAAYRARSWSRKLAGLCARATRSLPKSAKSATSPAVTV